MPLHRKHSILAPPRDTQIGLTDVAKEHIEGRLIWGEGRSELA